MANLKKNLGRFHGRISFVCFRFRTFQGKNGEWRGFFSYLRRNLLQIANLHYSPIYWRLNNLPDKLDKPGKRPMILTFVSVHLSCLTNKNVFKHKAQK